MHSRMRQLQQGQRQRQRRQSRPRTRPERQGGYNGNSRSSASLGGQHTENLSLPYHAAASYSYATHSGPYSTYSVQPDLNFNNNELVSWCWVPQLGIPYHVGYHQEVIPRNSFEAAFVPHYPGNPIISRLERTYPEYFSPPLGPGPEYPSTYPRFQTPVTFHGGPKSHLVPRSINTWSYDSNDFPQFMKSLPQPDMNNPSFCLRCNAKLVNGPISHPLKFQQWHSPESCAEQRSLNENFVARMRVQKTNANALAQIEAKTQAAELPAELPGAAERQKEKEDNGCEA